MGFRGIRYELGQCLHTEYEGGNLKAQPDGLGQDPKVKASDVLHPLGFAARPRATSTNPDGTFKGGGGCRLRIGYDGDELHVEFVGDQRALEGMPPLAAGDAVQYAHTANGAPSFHIIKGEDGTQQIYVEIGESAHLFVVGTDGSGVPYIEVTHADGQGILLKDHKAIIKNVAGDCYIELNDAGGVLNGNWKVKGDITDETGVSLFKHTHPTAMGPSGAPLPSLV